MNKVFVCTAVYLGLGILVGCDFYPRSNKYEVFEHPPKITPGQPSHLPKKPSRASNDEEFEISPEECNGTRALTPEGRCKVLNVRRFGPSERVQLPSGELIHGQIPSIYDGSAQRKRHIPRWPDQPLRKVSVDGFWVDVVEVTRKQYQSCVAENKCTPSRCPDGGSGIPANITDNSDQSRLPQTCVSHQQATKFCMSNNSRLPTAVEWEYAARGQDYRPFPWGDQLRDEVTLKVIPVGSKVDASYFGVLGLATSGYEWVADLFRPDHAMAEHIEDNYRDMNSPSSNVIRNFENQYFCAGRPNCRPTKTQRSRHVYKGVLVGHTMAAYDTPPQNLDTKASPEGWNPITVSSNLGFRCVSDLSSDDTPMHLTPNQRNPALTSTADSIESYVGTFEALTLAEAKRACQVLHIVEDGKPKTKWRLPTLEELNRIGSIVPGPGPYWLLDGQAATYSPQRQPANDENKTVVWTNTPVDRNETLLARCVQTL